MRSHVPICTRTYRRHQALHANRSQANVCQGCRKTFSRLDALNRHRKPLSFGTRFWHTDHVLYSQSAQKVVPNVGKL
ncbi:hypothetical protein SCLCIDRAFT_1208437 [Scleroderma citrinum Foug A]|uniref:C2H2-type domain-containing protein n=1 Tax=Scleroderma citrinum Foug A TaxID=1036808 RepID=A0A0C3EM82_9AGAM|nr:hypothetical protein SCLCIDRAFT_1208437 [Scleroderma citrinum Foug A]